ncbi:S1/P1 nuclease [Penicillium sp. IBT 35674x]|nr:S1/P1 nuclease [Penicillium sp. IBT 35674x]
MECDFSLSILFAWSLLCVPTLGWGDVGHRTVAYLAEQYLTEQGKDFLNDLLPRTRDFDISDAATWLTESSIVDALRQEFGTLLTSQVNDERLASPKWAKHLLQKNQHRPKTAVECADVTNPDVCVKKWAEETNHLNCAVVFHGY